MIYSLFSNDEVAQEILGFCLALLRKTKQSWKLIHFLLSMDEEKIVNIIKGERDVNNYRLFNEVSIHENDISESREIIKSLYKNGWSIVFLGSEVYPKEWEYLGAERPPLVFVKGNNSVSKNIRSVALVGTTNPSEMSKKLIKELVPFFLSNGFGHVSGGAVGIDVISHEEVIKLGGFTRVILPCGVFCYNLPVLWQRAIENGNMQIISPWLPDACWSSSQAVRRNLLIATLSHIACLFQPSHEGGSFSVAKNLLARGMPVFVYKPQGFAQILNYLPGAIPLTVSNNELNYPQLKSSLNIEIKPPPLSGKLFDF